MPLLVSKEQIDKALVELKKYAEEFTNLGDAKEARKNNEKEFLGLFGKVNQYFKFITDNVKGFDPEWLEALDIVSDIGIDNESMSPYVEMMINNMGKKEAKTTFKEETKKNESISSADIDAVIESVRDIVDEIRNMQEWDPSYVEKLDGELRQYASIINGNKNLVDEEDYNILMDGIDMTLNKIAKFKETIGGIHF